MRELTAVLGVAGFIGYLAMGFDLLGSVSHRWEEPPTAFRKAVVVAAWPVVLWQMRRL